MAGVSDGPLLYFETNLIQQPGRRTVEYFKVVNTWKFATLKSNGNSLWIVGQRFADPSGLWTGSEPADTKGMTLYRNGTQVHKSTISDFAAVPVPYGEADYRLEVEARRDLPGWEYSTRVTTTAQFKVNPQPDAQANHVSIPQLGYDAGVDLSNKVRAGETQRLDVTARPSRTGEAEIAKVQTWISYDDGRTWSELALSPSGAAGTWKAKFKAPRGTDAPKYVSLRTVATDANGHTIDQTLERAFGLR